MEMFLKIKYYYDYFLKKSEDTENKNGNILTTE